jgi:hypothetical protein
MIPIMPRTLGFIISYVNPIINNNDGIIVVHQLPTSIKKPNDSLLL